MTTDRLREARGDRPLTPRELRTPQLELLTVAR